MSPRARAAGLSAFGQPLPGRAGGPTPAPTRSSVRAEFSLGTHRAHSSCATSSAISRAQLGDLSPFGGELCARLRRAKPSRSARNSGSVLGTTGSRPEVTDANRPARLGPRCAGRSATRTGACSRSSPAAYGGDHPSLRPAAWMCTVGQVGAFDGPREVGARSAGSCDSLDMGQIRLVGAQIQVAGQQPDRAQLVERDPFRQERLLGDRGVLERLVKPGDHTCVAGDGCCDPADVFDQRASRRGVAGRGGAARRAPVRERRPSAPGRHRATVP